MTTWSSKMAVAISSGRAIANNDDSANRSGQEAIGVNGTIGADVSRLDPLRQLALTAQGTGATTIPADPSSAIVPYRERLALRTEAWNIPAAQAQRAADEAGADRDKLAARQVSAWRQRITAQPEPAEVGPARGRDVEPDALVDPGAVPPQVAPDLDHKPSGAAQWDVDDWRAYFDERAGIVEFDGGPSRADTEARAMACCVAKWLNRHPFRSSPDRCHACGDGPEREALVPFGTTNTGHVWLHGRCWREWHECRTAEAGAALAALGFRTTSKPRQ